jgi:DNA repair exonuclease SbcCD ATPase subunit
MECESEHKDKENLIYFRDILPNKNKIKENLNELKTKIEQYKEKINEIKKMFDAIIINLENYYEINDNLLKDLNKKKKKLLFILQYQYFGKK